MKLHALAHYFEFGILTFVGTEKVDHQWTRGPVRLSSPTPPLPLCSNRSDDRDPVPDPDRVSILDNEIANSDANKLSKLPEACREGSGEEKSVRTCVKILEHRR